MQDESEQSEYLLLTLISHPPSPFLSNPSCSKFPPNLTPIQALPGATHHSFLKRTLESNTRTGSFSFSLASCSVTPPFPTSKIVPIRSPETEGTLSSSTMLDDDKLTSNGERSHMDLISRFWQSGNKPLTNGRRVVSPALHSSSHSTSVWLRCSPPSPSSHLPKSSTHPLSSYHHD